MSAKKKARHRPVCVQDLSDDPRLFLLCQWCGEQCSANPGDYFNAKPETVFYHCGSIMLLCRRTLGYEVIS